MKSMTCDLCDATAEGEAFGEWMKALMPHYMEAHAEAMQGKAGLSDEEKKAEMDNWMLENKARFEAAA